MRGPLASETCRPSRSTEASWPVARSIATRVPLASSRTWPALSCPVARPPDETTRLRISSGPFVIQVQVRRLLPFASNAVERERVGLAPVGRQGEREGAAVAGRDGGRGHGALRQRDGAGRGHVRPREALEAPREGHLLEAREVVAVLDAEPAVEGGRQAVEAAELEEDRRPDLLDREEARLLLPVRADDAVRAVVPVGVERAVPVGAHDPLVGQVPEERPDREGVLEHAAPEVREPRAVAAVVEAVQHLRGHDELRPVQVLPGAAVVGAVVRRVDLAGLVLPRVDDRALLRVVGGVVVHEVVVEAALVAVVPEDHRGVVDVAHDELAHERVADLRVVAVLPAGQLVEDVEALLVAHLQEAPVGRVVGHAHGVHVHVLDELHVHLAHGAAGGAAGVGPEAVAVDALEPHLDAVDVEAVPGAQLDGAEAEALGGRVDRPCRRARARPRRGRGSGTRPSRPRAARRAS